MPKKYKRNKIVIDLHRSKRKSPDFAKNIYIYIKSKFANADFRTKFIDSVIKDFEYNERIKNQQIDFIIPPNIFEEPKPIIVVETPFCEDHFIIPPNLFEEPKPRIVAEIPFCEFNEKRLSIFTKKFNYFTNDSYDLNIVWETKKVKPFFPLKDKNLHPSCKIYYGLCSWGENYVRETERNISVRYDKHNQPSNKTKPAANLQQNNEHYFFWRILGHASSNARTCINFGKFFVPIMRPILNEQIDSDALILFRNGVTGFMR